MRAGSDRGVVALQKQDKELDLRALGTSLWRKKWKIIVPGLIAAGLSLLAVNAITPRYKSEARLLVEGRDNIFLRPDAERLSTENRERPDLEALTSQAQILQSREVALTVIKELRLDQKPEFNPAMGGVSVPSIFLSILGLGKGALNLTIEERVLTNYFERLSVLPVDKSRVILIEFQSSDPELSARVVNAIVDAYFTVQKANKQEQARGASRWLASEIDKLRPKVIEAENNVENFRAKANLYVGNNNTNLGNQQLTDMTTQLAAARAQKADLDARSRIIRGMLNSGKPIEASDVTNSDLIRRLIEQRVTLRSQLAEQSSTLLDQHPRIKELRAQVYALNSQIRGEAEKIVHTVENDARIASGRIEATNAAIDQLKKQISGVGSQDVQLRALEREAKAQRDLLEVLSREIPRSERARFARRDADRCACDLARHCLERSGFPEEGSDHPDHDLRHHVPCDVVAHHRRLAARRRAGSGREGANQTRAPRASPFILVPWFPAPGQARCNRARQNTGSGDGCRAGAKGRHHSGRQSRAGFASRGRSGPPHHRGGRGAQCRNDLHGDRAFARSGAARRPCRAGRPLA